MLLPEGISTRSLFLWHQISDWDPFNLNATPKLHLPENFHVKKSMTEMLEKYVYAGDNIMMTSRGGKCR